MPKKKTTMQRTRHNIILILLLLIASNTMGQRFINLTADEVTIDSVMPVVSYALLLPSDYSDSIYTAEILYPEFLDMDDDDIARYNRIASRDGIVESRAQLDAASSQLRRWAAAMIAAGGWILEDPRAQE